MPRLRYQPRDVPRLAWCARVPRTGDVVDVEHGPGVECRPDFFFEGAWAGPFEAGGFVGAEVCAGSGGRVSGEGVVFATPTYVIDRLQLLEGDEGLFVSNSLAFLLARTGERLDPAYPFYVRDLTTIALGLERGRRAIPTRSGREIGLVYHADLEVAPGRPPGSRAKPAPAPFRDFAHYRAYLRDAAAAVADNAADPARHTRYRPLATLSSGYDSAACAVLAREIGCREGITFPEARTETGEFASVDDSGAPIARLLGMRVAELDRRAYLARDDCPEAEFLAHGTRGGEVPFVAAEGLLRGRLLVTGYYGDTVWRRDHPRPTGDLLMAAASGGSLCELRLRVGFVHFPLPFAGCLQRPSIHAITDSPELAPFRVGGDYDRPIARRLLEEAGVPRGLFGQEKKAPTQPFNPARGNARLDGRSLAGILSERSLREFRAYLAAHCERPGRAARAGFALRRALFRVRPPLPERARALLRRPALDRIRDVLQDGRYEFPVREHDFLFHWAMERTLGRYVAAPGADGAGTT